MDLAGARQEIADACRVLAHRGLTPDILGHVSMRVDDQRLLVRGRGPDERGLLFTTAHDVRLVNLHGDVLDDASDGWRPPNELPIHTEILRAHTDVFAVVHAHPPAVVASGLAGIELRPIFGAFDIPATKLALGGIPTFPRSVLIRRAELAYELLVAMGDRPACVLHGHGLVTTGATVVQATLTALAVDNLARMSLAVAQAGGGLVPIAEADIAELPDLGASFTEATLWRHHLARLAADGHAERE